MRADLEVIRKKLEVEKFFCCLSLRHGCFIIGTLGWILTIFKIAFLVGTTILSENAAVTYYDVEYKICYIFVMFVACAALLWGAYKYKKSYVRPWLIVKGFEISIMIIMTIIDFGLLFYEQVHLAYAILTFFAFLIGSILGSYFWVCVWNYYQQIDLPNPNAIVPEGLNGEETIAHIS